MQGADIQALVSDCVFGQKKRSGKTKLRKEKSDKRGRRLNVELKEELRNAS